MADSADPGGPLPAEAEIAALRHQNEILRETLDAIDGTLVVYDADRRFVLANKAYHEFFPHLPPDEALIGRRYEELLADSIAAATVSDPQAYSDPTSFIERRVRLIDRRDATPRETYHAPSGRWFLIRVRHGPDGRRVALRVDITEQKRLQQELDQARAAAERANRGKSQFLANISHELRTPLNAVINFARLLVDQIHGPLGAPSYVEYAQSIRDSGTHLLALIEQLLDFARAEAGRLTLSEQPVNLRALLLSVARLLHPEADKAGIIVNTDVPADLPPVQGDATRLRQVLFSLLSNAIKYTGRGGRVDISARLVPDDGELEISVADNGPGIAEADVARVLLPFERAVEQRDSHRPGIGLGLTLVSHLVAQHGGRLTLESKPGQGTIARVFLPATRVLTTG